MVPPAMPNLAIDPQHTAALTNCRRRQGRSSHNCLAHNKTPRDFIHVSNAVPALHLSVRRLLCITGQGLYSLSLLSLPTVSTTAEANAVVRIMRILLRSLPEEQCIQVSHIRGLQRQSKAAVNSNSWTYPPALIIRHGDTHQRPPCS